MSFLPHGITAVVTRYHMSLVISSTFLCLAGCCHQIYLVAVVILHFTSAASAFALLPHPCSCTTCSRSIHPSCSPPLALAFLVVSYTGTPHPWELLVGAFIELPPLLLSSPIPYPPSSRNIIIICSLQ